MGDATRQRVNSALSSLIDNLVLCSSEEDKATTDKRRNDALGWAKGVIHRRVKIRKTETNLTNVLYSRGEPDVVSDVNHASDLIKKKLLHDHGSPDKALQFSNLYSRLLLQPVVTQKWAILFLLYKIADSGTGDVASSRSAIARSDVGQSPQREGTARSGPQQNGDPPPVFDDAFSSAGLARLPTRNNRPESKAEGSGQTEQRNLAQNDGDNKAREVAGSDANRGNLEKPTESALLHDLPFTLQGLSSTCLPFTSPASLTLPPALPLPLISLLHTLAEPSLLYRSLSDYIGSKDEGLIGQSLRSTIGGELRSYLGLIAALEGEIRRAIVSIGPNEPRGGIGKAGVTLKKAVVWTRDATMGLRLMSLMTEEAKIKKGGQLISMIHSFSTSHGDPFVGAFAERMLVHVTKPFYDMLRQWIYDGELSDPYREFFVIEQDPQSITEKDADPRRAPATSVWEDKYKLAEAMIPSIITGEFARKIFLIGKSLNFIRYGCGESAWVEAYCKEASRELQYGDTATLETSIDKAYKATMARLIHLMDDKFQLFEHLRALKKYLLLGQGDFIALLMESLASNLDRPAGTQYRHTLTAQLEHAIRGSNAQYDSPDVLLRLDARLLALSNGEVGWDVFTLDYKVDAPVDVIITPWASRQYLKVFQFLWRIKRVEFALGSTWRRCMTGARGVLAKVDDEISRDWKSARCCIAEMIHFVNQLQYYILFEVIEASWDQLQAAITKPDCTLDDLIDAHTKYLRSITHKGLLGSARSSTTGTREDSFTSQLHHILKLMLAYREAVDGLYSSSVAEFTRRQELAAKIETRTAQGKWGLSEKDLDDEPAPSPFPLLTNSIEAQTRTDSPFPVPIGIAAAANSGDDQMLPTLRARLKDLSTDFRAKVSVLLGDLSAQPDVDMKFLGVVMNFNDVYVPKKRKRERGAGDRRTPAEKLAGGKGAEKGGKEEEREK